MSDVFIVGSRRLLEALSNRRRVVKREAVLAANVGCIPLKSAVLTLCGRHVQPSQRAGVMLYDTLWVRYCFDRLPALW